jgi:AraC family transcriptional regulator
LRYLAQLRIDAARHLLMHSSDLVSTVGRGCGFPNAKSLARTFRQNVGCSPSQYRSTVHRR